MSRYMRKYVQLSLFTRHGQIYSPDTERTELKIDVLNHLCKIFHLWNGGNPLEVSASCQCGTGLRTLVMPHGLSVAFCPECSWHCEVRLDAEEEGLSEK